MQYVPDFVTIFASRSDNLSMEILDQLRSSAAVALKRTADTDYDTTELETAIGKMNEHLSLLESSIEAVEQAFDTIRQLECSDDD